MLRDAMRTIPDVDHHYPQHHPENSENRGHTGRRSASDCVFLVFCLYLSEASIRGLLSGIWDRYHDARWRKTHSTSGGMQCKRREDMNSLTSRSTPNNYGRKRCMLLLSGFCAVFGTHDIWNVDSILQTPLQRLEARHLLVVHSGLASPDSGYDRAGWRGDEGARTTMELGTGDQLAAFIGDRQF